MGTKNVHAFAHRLTALSMACLASAALIFCALSGLGCSYVEIGAFEGKSVGNAYGEVFQNANTAYIGVQCLSASDAPFYDADGNVDRLWGYTRIFFYVGLGLGGVAALFAWMLGTCVRPTPNRWRILSILAALAAVFQIPMFLVVESDNCTFDISRQTCALSTGAYINVASISIWIVMTVWVQFLRAPRWDEEIDAWRVDGNRSTSSPVEFINIIQDEVAAGKDLEFSDGMGGDRTAETMEMGIPLSPPPKQPGSLSSKKQKSKIRPRTKEIKAKEPIIADAGTNTERVYPSVTDKSVSADTGKHAVNTPHTNGQTVTSSSTNQADPGLHMSCIYSDGTKEEVHLPSLQNCCIGILGEITEGDEEPKPRKQESEELGFVAYDEYGLEDTNSADFLVRKLQMEEEAAAARRAERNMAPVASFEFSKNGSKTNRRKDGGYGSNAPVVSDDVSEMTRGSGFTGVSEILDGKAIIEDLERTY